jgi:hypothetical protein
VNTILEKYLLEEIVSETIDEYFQAKIAVERWVLKSRRLL